MHVQFISNFILIFLDESARPVLGCKCTYLYNIKINRVHNFIFGFLGNFLHRFLNSLLNNRSFFLRNFLVSE